MDGLLILRHIKVENANAIAGLTWGFPAISNFLGFVHALSRKLPQKLELDLNGCGVVCHEREVLAYQPRGWGDYVFSLTRNPLVRAPEKGSPKNAKSPSFVEEGRMHMTISLVISIAGDLDTIADQDEFKQLIEQLVFGLRLAGGTILNIEDIDLYEPPEDYEGLKIFTRNQLRKLLPGFALVQRSELLAKHTKFCKKQDSDAEPLDAWLDFSALKYKAKKLESENEINDRAEWQYIPKPSKGWLVPIPIGYRGISKLYEPGKVARTRDDTTPFRFVEAVYSIGEWLSPHRLNSLDQLIWRYYSEPETGWYLCKNNFESIKKQP